MHWSGLPRSLHAQEARACHWANGWCLDRRIRALFSVISRLGDGGIWALLILGFATSGDAKAIPAAVHLASLGVVMAILYRLLKNSTRRPRPCHAHRTITAWVAPLDEFSFPSGHTLHAVGFSTVAIIYLPWLAGLLLPLTVLIAMSRVVLGLHYPSDVLVAMLLGFVLALASFTIWA